MVIKKAAGEMQSRTVRNLEEVLPEDFLNRTAEIVKIIGWLPKLRCYRIRQWAESYRTAGGISSTPYKG